MKNNVPNLDAMDVTELTAFAKHHEAGRNYSELFSYCSDEERVVARVATANLSRYANNKRRAIQHRLDGKIDHVMGFEDLCDWFYKRIPKEYRW